MKKWICTILVLAIISMFSYVPLFATNMDLGTAEKQIVESVYDNNKLVTVFEENVVTMNRYSLDTNELVISVQWERDSDHITVLQDGATKTLSIDAIASSLRRNTSRANSLNNETSLGYAYTIYYGNYNSWSLYCPQYDDGNGVVHSFACAERDSYLDELESFREDVDNIAALERKIEARTSARILNAAYVAAFIATNTPTGFGFALSSWFEENKYSLEVQDLAADIGPYQKDAYDKYWRILQEWSELASLNPEFEVK